MALATLAERTAALRALQRSHPARIRAYALSCWMYSLSGAWYLHALPRLPLELQATPLMSGTTFGVLLLLQGLCSYLNDARLTLGHRVWPGRPFWLCVDRSLAWVLMCTVVGNAIVWPPCGAHARAVSVALVATCVVTYPCSKFCEVQGWMRAFVAWHSVWHYVPNLLAMTWVGLCAYGGE
ncbi:hypothetical protein AB1Y20_016520 [Prymnesium parvum]|uniref:Post-GPI attachment to proteins factor 3 n=1 Tax=Prymnesium parvum TaxID=97485 RepID=A0AB34ICN4_PRYPA